MEVAGAPLLSKMVKVEVRRRDEAQAVARRRRASRLPTFFHSAMEGSASSSDLMSSMFVQLSAVMWLCNSSWWVMAAGKGWHHSRSLG